MNQLCRKLWQAIIFSVCKSVLDCYVLSLDPSEVAELLPERFQEHRHAGTGAVIQKTDARDFLRLLRYRGSAKRKEQRETKRDYFFLRQFFSHTSRLSPHAI